MILIDIKMPEKCGLCPLFHAEHPMYCQGVKADCKKKIVAPYGQPRPDWCPLHEVTADSIENNSIHLCDSCLNKYPECDAVEIIFGDGRGDDNICCCNKYEPIMEHDYERGGCK